MVKLALQSFAMLVVFIGLATTSFNSTYAPAISSHLSAAALGPGPLSLPIPTCGPGVPTCGNSGIW
jgi:hypothetical protein